MSAVTQIAPASTPDHWEETPALNAELSKLLAFLRRDFLMAWSYRVAFITDIGSLVVQVIMFNFVGKIVNPDALPSYGGTQSGYMEFVAVGILMSSFVEIGLSRVANSIRQEQLMGTLESVLLTPTAISTIQCGSVVYPLVYLPIRTLIFLGIVGFGFGVQFNPAGILPTFALLILFLPFVWGLGVASAAGMLTFRRGGMGVGFISTLLVLGSGAFFPLSVLPHWVQTVSAANPIARATNGMRDALIAGSWQGMPQNMLVIAIGSAIVFPLGLLAFKLALARELRRGTLGIY
jgi:ABC-2 type transport system permease protein